MASVDEQVDTFRLEFPPKSGGGAEALKMLDLHDPYPTFTEDKLPPTPIPGDVTVGVTSIEDSPPLMESSRSWKIFQIITSMLSMLCILALVSWVTHSFMPCQIVLSPLSSSTELTNQDIKFIHDGPQQFGIEKISLPKIGHSDFISERFLGCRCFSLNQKHVVSSSPYQFEDKGQNNSALQELVKNNAFLCHGDVENKWYHVSWQNASGIIKRCP